MKIEILKNESFANSDNFPQKATGRSTGYDVIASSEPEIVGEKNEDGKYKRIDYIQYKTNLKIAVQKEKVAAMGFGMNTLDYDVLAFPRSSISKYNLLLANSIGLIDADYRGEVLLRFKYIWQPEDFDFSGEATIVGNPNLEKIYKKGDKICQLKVTKVENIEFSLVNELDSTDRGDGGFGSTDVNKEKNEIASKQMSSMEILYKNLNNAPSTPQKKYTDLIKEREIL